ncbi:MAG: hypothetical protein OXG78_14890 [Chloroflexi bacterium]|nr:hypothetical protein [Chloroflexota bacterium]
MVTKTVFKQIRGFVIAWLLITALVCMATFLAVYFTYNPEELNDGASNPLPLESPEIDSKPDAALVVLSSVTPEPTVTPTKPPPSPTLPVFEEEATDLPPPTEVPSATPLPTQFPVDVMNYQVGIQVEHSLDFNPVNQDNYYRSVARDLGLRWVKQQVRWDLAEPEPGEIDWSILDFVMPSARRFDIKMLLSILATPAWAREPDVNLERHGPPADPLTYANFVAEVVKRYPGAVHAIEVWNEQNIDREWTSIHGLNAGQYVELLRRTYEVVKAIDPGIIIISGALSPTGVDDGVGAIDDFRYMDAQIDAGMLDWADCVGAHHNGYNVSPDYRYNDIPDDSSATFRGPFDNPHHSWSFRSTLEGYANRIRTAGYETRLCVTEFGWPSSEGLTGVRPGFEFAQDNTLAEQAEWTPKALSNMEEWGFVWLAFIWNFNYGPQAGFSISNDNVPYSLIGPPYEFRPAFDAIRDWQRDYLARIGP